MPAAAKNKMRAAKITARIGRDDCGHSVGRALARAAASRRSMQRTFFARARDSKSLRGARGARDARESSSATSRRPSRASSIDPLSLFFERRARFGAVGVEQLVFRRRRRVARRGVVDVAHARARVARKRASASRVSAPPLGADHAASRRAPMETFYKYELAILYALC